MTTTLIEVANICKAYKMGDNVVLALQNVSLTIDEGDYVAIMGPSGSGKSTLMHTLGLLDVPDIGSYKLCGEETAHLTDDGLAALRSKTIGFIFQQFNLLPRVSACENVSLPLMYSERQHNLEKAKGLLSKVGLRSRADHRPNELSGGQQQRVAIARSLVNDPRLVLADEPTGNLDSSSEKEIMAILENLNAQGITIVIVTHEDEIGKRASRVIRMRDGRIVSDERQRALSSAKMLQASRRDVQQSLRFTDVAEYFRQGIQTLAANKVRTALSVLGILIGVAAVVAMLALGKGAQKAIESQLASLGSNLLVLRPGAVRVMGVALDSGSVTRIAPDDATVLMEKIPSIAEASPNVQGRGQITYGNKNWSTQVLGASSAYATMHAAMPEFGRFFLNEENLKRSRVAVIGMTLVRQLFGDQNPIGETIKINRVLFQVIGILPEKGANGFRDQDDIVVVPVLTAMRRVLGRDYIDFIDIEVKQADKIAETQEAVLQTMLSRHKVAASQQTLSQGPFEIRNMADIQAALSESSRTMSVLLAVIAAISLVVGGIGIMNIMLVSVTERTREIGLRKAIGARSTDILVQFLAEAVLVSAIGGIAGIILGWTTTEILSSVSGWATSVSLSSVLLAFVFSAGIGIVFGIYPAKKASLLNPIAALRHD